MPIRRRRASGVWALALRLLVGLVMCSAVALIYRFWLHPDGSPPFWPVAALTAGVAAVLWSARDRISSVADRLAFGEAAGGYQEMRSLLNQMATTLPVDDVIPTLAQTLSRRARSSRAEVRLNLDDGAQWTQVWPASAGPSRESVTVQISHRGADVGEIDLESESGTTAAFDRALLDEIAGPAGLALSTVRLTYALRHRMAELEYLNSALAASQQRLIGARVVEQRRFQDEVDERVLPEIAAVTQVVTTAREAAKVGAPYPDLAAAAVRLGRALDVLRSIARGIYPPRLAEAGLAVSLESWRGPADQTAVVLVRSDLAPLHEEPELEAAGYFALVSALAKLNEATVDLAVDADAFVFRVVAAAAMPAGVAFAVRDRIEAFDGTVAIHDSADGVIIDGRLPLGRQALPAKGRLA